MKPEFNAEFFRGNRERLRTLFTGKAPIVLTANSLLQRATSMTYPFQQDGSFWYLTGLDEPDLVLVMDKNKEYLILPELSQYQEVFDGGLNPDVLSKISGVETVVGHKDGWRQLKTRLNRVKHVATVAAPPSFVDVYGMYTNPARAELIKQLKNLNPNLEPLDLAQHLQRLRMVKQPAELAAITGAINATIHALSYVEKKFRTGDYAHEYEVELDLTRQYWKKGAAGHSFDPIVASAERGLVLHRTDKAEIDPDKQLLVDVGAAYNHYAADISRTWMRNPTKRFMAVHDAVCEVADYAMAMLKPGVILQDYEKKVETFMGEKLRELGLIKTIEHDEVRKYFSHATSHFLGIDVHDVGDYSYPVSAGVVLTVEPGIYIPEEGIGVRIEDDVIITDNGCENLSKALAR